MTQPGGGDLTPEQVQFLIAVYGIVTAIATSLTTLVQDLGPYAGPILEVISAVLFAAEVTLYYVRAGVCALAP